MSKDYVDLVTPDSESEQEVFVYACEQSEISSSTIISAETSLPTDTELSESLHSTITTSSYSSDWEASHSLSETSIITELANNSLVINRDSLSSVVILATGTSKGSKRRCCNESSQSTITIDDTLACEASYSPSETFIKDVLTNYSSDFNQERFQSVSFAAETRKVSKGSGSIEALQSTSKHDTFDCDASSYSLGETFTKKVLTNDSLKINRDRFQQQQSTTLEDDTLDCDASSHFSNETFIKNTSKDDSFKIDRGRVPSIILAAGPSKVSRGSSCIESLYSTIVEGILENTIDEYDKPEDSHSENSDSEVGLDPPSIFLSKYPQLEPYTLRLAEVLQKASLSNNIDSKRISGLEVISLIDNLQRSMLNLPDTKEFLQDVYTFATSLYNDSRKITVDQLARVLIYIHFTYDHEPGK
ncbi:uncharacterized protein LOC117172854 [Belonocnema kinseyi]|uniref:uncharacterized protein LOC117172854 n=1 Tax=Belonocnema kinseyi TaxID=2817044 RepID=UPI00143D7607|nr:uncharacterized protein LOC117172854 [Belonocnema kinseyi]